MKGQMAIYRTADGQGVYVFSFKKIRWRDWRVYVEVEPPYGNRVSCSCATHRLSDGGKKYICWSTRIKSLDKAKQIAALWAESTQEYIKTGKKF